MSGFSLTVVWISMVGSAIATIVSIRASVMFTTWAGSPFTRLALILSATFSAVSCLGYVWLLNHPTRGGDWSATMRPVGMLSWMFGPWIAFPIALEYQMKRRAKKMKQKTAKLLKEVRDIDQENSCDGGCSVGHGSG